MSGPSPLVGGSEQFGLSSQLIHEAAQFLDGRIRRTPMERSAGLSELVGSPVSLKLESLQLTGSFKIRGALFRISRLTRGERRSGVLTCSAGNHGKSVAYAAREAGVKAIVCVPKSIDPAKLAGIRALGADTRISEFDGYDDTEEWARELAVKLSMPFLSPFDDYFVMAGNGGTLALEVMKEAPDARVFLLPVGGGGLAAGFAFAVKERYPDAVIIGCQHALSPALRISLEAGYAVTRLPAVDTMAGGIEGGIGARAFEELRTRVTRVALATEREILRAACWMIEAHQYLIEPSAAVTVAACLERRVSNYSAPMVVIISGRNVGIDGVRAILNSERQES